MVEAAIAISIGGIVVGLILAALIYLIGVYVFHGPPTIIGLIAFLVFVLCVIGNISTY